MRNLLRGAANALALIGITGAALQAQDDRPSLIVMIAVDQLRADLVERYDEAFTGGIRRFLDQGYVFTQASHAHARTHTAAGHATLSTGVFPSRSGIVANEWRQKRGSNWVSMYAVEDLDHPILGFETEPALPGRSPKNLLRTGLADWVRAADGGARTLSVSAKDRAAITMAGQTSENVYWLLSPLARFVTSTYYDDGYPRWVREFNVRVMPSLAADTAWESEVPQYLQHLARPDSADYENGGRSTFPHLSSLEGGGEGPQLHNAWVFEHSRADAAVLAFARTAVDELDLGRRDEVDYLAVSLSATDYVGHMYGPLSQEQFSNLIHLDRELGAFFEFLDDFVGEGRWVVGLSSDHGVLTNPEAAREMGDLDAERIDLRERTGDFSRALGDAAVGGGTPEEVSERLANLVEERGLAAKAYTHHDLTRGEPADSFGTLFRNSHYPGRAHGILSQYGVEMRFEEGDLVSAYPTGTTHGSPYWYDREVPFMLLGAGVRQGSSNQPVYTVDLAPTLAELAGIPVPDDLDGRSVYR